jgi:hypothetical protein
LEFGEIERTIQKLFRLWAHLALERRTEKLG